MAELTEAVSARWAGYEAAYKAGDVTRLGTFYTDSVRLSGPDSWWRNVQGREAVQGVLAQTLPEVTVQGITFGTEDLVPLGDHAFESGTWTEDYTIDPSPDIERISGGYTALWERQADGVWKISRLMWNVHTPEESSPGDNN
jgi:ketosteroid isomerase-like protein